MCIHGYHIIDYKILWNYHRIFVKAFNDENELLCCLFFFFFVNLKKEDHFVRASGGKLEKK